MSYGGNPEDEELRLRVVYEASQVVKDAIADIRKLKEETGALNKEQEETLKQLEYQKTLLEGAGSGLDHYIDLINEEVTAQKLLRQALEEEEVAQAAANATMLEAGRIADEKAAAGFAKLTQGAFQAERAMTALATGHGIARVGPMLEKLIGSAGGPAGIGFGIAGIAFLLETIGPKVKGFLESWAESAGLMETSQYVKEIADDMERALKAAEALEKTPSVSEAKTKAAVGKAITARGGAEITSQIELGLAQTTKLEEYMTPGERETMALAAQQTTPEARAAAAMHGQRVVSEAEAQGVMKNARDKRAERAKAWMGQLSTDRGSREGLRQLAQAAPGVFGRGFMTELDLAEPEAQADAEQIKRGETAAGKELQSGYGVKRKQEIKREKEWKQGVARQDSMLNQADREEKSETAKGAAERFAFEQKKEHDAEAAAKKAEHGHEKAVREQTRQQQKYAREHTPEAMNRAQIREAESQALGAVQQNTYGFSGGQQKAIAKHLQASYEQGYGMSNSFQDILADAIGKAREEMSREASEQGYGGKAPRAK